MDILLTGGSGFLGKNLLEQLGGKYNIVAPQRAELDLFDTQSVANFFVSKKFDVVIHAASVGGNLKDAAVTDVVEKNMKMFFNLRQHKGSFGKMIYLGSGAEYDKRQSLVKVTEQQFGLNIPADNYGFSKFLCSKYIEVQENIINLRCFGIFGKYEDYRQRFISNNICNALLGRPLSINQDAVFDFIYINDLIKVIEYFINNNAKQKFYNVGSSQAQNLTEIAEVIKKVCGSKEIVIKNSGMNKEYSCDVTLLKNEIGDIPHTNLEQAIKEMVEYYQQHLDEVAGVLKV